jgi:GNAT superfamily N-acetyltransferase
MLIRRATPSDVEAVAEVYVRARHHAVPAIPPLRGPDDEVREWLSGVVLSGGEVWLAEPERRQVVGVMLLEGDWIEQLYVEPSWIGRGIGTELIGVAKRSRPEGLQLWMFQSNHRAHRFYERHGFVAEEWTDGRGNQEQAPDARLVWRPS